MPQLQTLALVITNTIKKTLFMPKKYQTVQKLPDSENKISFGII